MSLIARVNDDSPLWGVIPKKEEAVGEEAEIERLRTALAQVRHGCLMNIRRAAFGPEIGVRYTEAIRSDISNQCWRLERFIDATLAKGKR